MHKLLSHPTKQLCPERQHTVLLGRCTQQSGNTGHRALILQIGFQTDNKPETRTRQMHADPPRHPRNHQSDPIISSRIEPGRHTDRLIRTVGGNEAPLAVRPLNQMAATTNPIAGKTYSFEINTLISVALNYSDLVNLGYKRPELGLCDYCY